MRREAALGIALAAALALAGCAASVSGASTAGGDSLMVSPQDSSLTVGVDRVSVALLDARRNPVNASGVTLQVRSAAGRVVETRPLSNIAPQYGGIPVYVGLVRFPDVGQFEYVVQGTSNGSAVSGHAFVTVSLHGPEVAVGDRVPAESQAILGDPGVTIAKIDSGVPPDSWHNETIAQGVAQHKPMVLFFGDPAYCPSKTCGPTRDILQQLCQQFCGQLLFEHIETYYPAGPPGPSATVNPAFDAFHLQTDPWIYFVNANGVVSDRYEGPVTLAELTQSAQGTLAGSVPAVGLTT
jgi:hypothetical protein